MERRKFEDELKRAFQGAEVEPTENVWTNIELDLERAEGNDMKRKVLFYKVLAAASITFAMCVAGIGYYTLTHQDQFNLNGSAQIAGNEEQATEKDVIVEKSDLTNTVKTESNNAEDQQLLNDKNYTALNKVDGPSSSSRTLSVNAYRGEASSKEKFNSGSKSENNNTQEIKSSDIANSNIMTDNNRSSEKNIAGIEKTIETKRVLPKLYSKDEPALLFPKTESVADPVALMFAKLNDLERELSEEKKEKKSAKNEKLWTSVGFSAGGFNTINPSISPRTTNAGLMAAGSNVADKQSKSSGTAYSAGISLGTSISKRWVLQGGVNYLSQLSDYTATEAFGSADLQSFKAASLNEFRASDAQAENKLISTAPYTINNNVQFISMPVQAGYLIVNKKLGWQLNAGVATDLFLQNTIDPEGGSLDKTTQGRGDDSPYRSVNFSGLVGTELSYRFGQRYRIALNPGLRYPFNSIYKSDLGIEAMPLTLDVGLRFRYIFQ